MTPAAAYRRLLRQYGPQGWWPVTPPGAFTPRYRPRRPSGRTERESGEIAVGAILTQNTNWTNVERALEALHRDGPLTFERLRRMPLRRLQRLVRSSGYFRQKALKLRDFADALASRGGSLKAWLARRAAREELLDVRGVGPETADSILLYAGSRDAFVIDAYTLRIGSRVGWFGPKTRYGEARAMLDAALRPRREPVGVFQEFHALLVRLAKEHCRAVPSCAGCPLQGGCLHGARA